ncbi:PilZ domain-containing protein [Nitrospira sp. NS4]|uniref:PilZ domain-containing protein n=1 Tax=Nitrospira sp. NS4 TaxID=3414498 RepID=UPI003C2BD6CE
MPQPEPVTILIVNEQADDIKLVTMSLRGFFPDCRVDSVYSVEEALQWAGRADWHLVLIEERLGLQGHPPLVSELKHRLPAAALVLQTEKADSGAAVSALQAGADFLLHRQSPAFLTEFVLYAKEAIEKRALRTALERIQVRHGRLMETLTDVVYELDADGRFVYVSPSVTELLGHRPEELTGTLCTKLIPPDQLDRAQHRINDRRSGPRAARRVLLELLPKPQPGSAPGSRVLTEISATGLYDAGRRFVGSLGLLRNVSAQAIQAQRIQSLEAALRETGQLLDMAHHVTGLSHHLQAPLTAVLTQSQQLLQTIRETQLDARLEILALHATEAAQRGEEIAQTVQQAARRRDTVNTILDDALATFTPPLLETGLVERLYTPSLPAFAGPRETCVRLVELLLAHALRHMAAVGSIHRLQLSTCALDRAGARLDPAPSLPVDPATAAVEILFQETQHPAAFDTDALTMSSDLARVYELLPPLGARLDFLAPAEGRLSIRLRLHLPDRMPPASTPTPAAPPAPQPSTAQKLSSPAAPPAESQPQHPAPVVPALPDRRTATRATVHLPAQITVGNITREGTVSSLSATGAAVVLAGLLPHLDHQPAYLIFKTEVGILELQARVHTRGTASGQESGRPGSSLLAFHFAPAGTTESRVLASFVEAASERAVSFTFEALLVPPEDAEELPPPTNEPAPHGLDHREALRVRVALPVHIEVEPEGTTVARAFGSLANLSRGGACLQMKQAPGRIGQTILLQFPQTGLLGQPRIHEPAAPEAVLPARIVWTPPAAPSTLRPDSTDAGQRVGLCFVRLTPFAEREINRVVAQHLNSPMDLDGVTEASPVVSTQRECRNARGQVIVMRDDHARRQLSPSTPIVIMSPGFGCTQTDYVGLAQFLALNRMRVLRYDHSNHVGHSDGDLLQITLRSMQTDLQAVLEFAHTTWPTAPIALLAEDLAARVALKAAAQSPAADLLLLVNPVVDVQTALSAEHHRDLVADYRKGRRKGTANVWGLNVNVDQLLGDLIAGQYDTLATTVTDLAGLTAPIVMLTTPETGRTPAHPFPPFAPSLRALGTPPAVVPLAAPLSVPSMPLDDRHLAAWTTILRHIATALFPREAPGEILPPIKHHVERQRRLEEERLRIHTRASQATRDALWVAQSAQLLQLSRLPAYSWLLQELYQQCLPLPPRATILEVGCASSDLARIAWLNSMYRLAHAPGTPRPPLRYIGIERLIDTVSSTERSFEAFRQELNNTGTPLAAAASAMTAGWILADWQSGLPFIDHSVDRLVYNLSLSFVSSPQASLRHAVTVLRPDGLLILTCFQPHTDLTGLYREHLAATGQDGDSPSGQILLHYLGRLHEALRHGLLHSFNRDRLAELLRHAGAKPLRIVPVLNGQLLLAVSRKGESAG